MSDKETEMTPIYTIGHSSHSLDAFIQLLGSAEITAVADVRSSPFSRRSPQYNRRELEASLKQRSIEYRFFGKALGGRPKDPRLYVRGTANYEAMAQTEAFKEGIERVLKGAQKHRLALMCSELDPIECHRCLLIGRELANRQVPIRHLLQDGTIESQEEVEDRLLKLNRRLNRDFFLPHEEELQIAYRDQGMRVAYTERSSWESSTWEASDVQYG